MKKKIFVIFASPLLNGTINHMLQVAVSAAKEQGDEVTRINLYEKNIKFCCGCRKCLDEGSCRMKDDDMAEITELIKSADTIIFATPVYWASVPAILKNLQDRLLGVAMGEKNGYPQPRLSGKKYMVLSACNTIAPFAQIYKQSSGAYRTIHELGYYSGMKCIGNIVCTGTIKHQGISKRIENKIRKSIIR